MFIKSALAMIFSLAAAMGAATAIAQDNTDEPLLSQKNSGGAGAGLEDHARTEEQDDEDGVRDPQASDRHGQSLDEPRLRPLVFGRRRADEGAYDETGTSITLGEEDDNRLFFGFLNFLIPGETNLSVGLGPVYEPDYFGSDDYEWNVDPQGYVRFRNFLFLDDDGLDFAVIGFSNFRFGPTMRVRSRRDDGDNPALRGLGDVGTTFEFGGFAAATFLDRFSFKAKVRHGLKTGHRGTVVDGYLTALLFRAGDVSLAASGQASWVGNRYAEAYFSVTPAQSVASGGRLRAFDANAGFQNVGATVTAYINIRDRWSLNPYASYNYIFAEIADTPIISDFGDRHQLKVGLHLMREFQFK